MKITAYHGSNAKFDKFDQGKARIVNDFYGGGVAYFTDELSVAKSYARSMAKRGGDRYVYEVSLSLRKVFDVDDTFTGRELTKFFDDSTIQDFARGAGLLKLGADRYIVLDRLKSGKEKLSGEQVFKGLSKGMVNTLKTREKLIELGYDGLRYNGGRNMGMATQHNVYLAYKASSINIVKRYKMVAKTNETVNILKKVVLESQEFYK